MASGWYVKRGTKEQGPFSSQQLQELAASGKIKKTDQIRKNGTQKAYPAAKVKGLFAAPQPQPKPRPAREPEDDYGTVVIIEEDPEADLVAYAEEDDPTADDFDDYEDYEFDDYEDYETYDDDLEPASRSRRGTRNRGGSSRGRKQRTHSSRLSSRENRNRRRQPRKRKSKDGEEEGPWMSLFHAFSVLAGGILLFYCVSMQDPNTWEGTNRRGLAGQVFMVVFRFVYNVGGRWAILGLAVAGSLYYFVKSARQFQSR